MSDGDLVTTVLAAFEKWSADLRASAATKSREDSDLPLAYNQQDAARLLGIAATALRDLRLKGEVEAVKLGKRVIYPRKSRREECGIGHLPFSLRLSLVICLGLSNHLQHAIFGNAHGVCQ